MATKIVVNAGGHFVLEGCTLKNLTIQIEPGGNVMVTSCIMDKAIVKPNSPKKRGRRNLRGDK